MLKKISIFLLCAIFSGTTFAQTLFDTTNSSPSKTSNSSANTVSPTDFQNKVRELSQERIDNLNSAMLKPTPNQAPETATAQPLPPPQTITVQTPTTTTQTVTTPPPVPNTTNVPVAPGAIPAVTQPAAPPTSETYMGFAPKKPDASGGAQGSGTKQTGWTIRY